MADRPRPGQGALEGRRRHRGASPAFETNVALAKDEIIEALPMADQDLQWAAAIASLAEVLKQSPYADRTQLATSATIIRTQAPRDPDRTEFAALFAKTMTMLGL